MDKMAEIRERHDKARCFISDNFDSAEEQRVDYFMTRHVIRKQYGDVQFLLSEYDRLTKDIEAAKAEAFKEVLTKYNEIKDDEEYPYEAEFEYFGKTVFLTCAEAEAAKEKL